MAYVPVIALGISLISLLASGLTFYFSHWRPALISATVGPSFKIYYVSGRALSFYLPMTFFNRSQNIGAVTAIELILIQDGEQLHFPWQCFSQYDAKSENWQFLSMVHTVAVPGRATVSHCVWFSWPLEAPLQPVLGPGVYEFRLRYTILPAGRVHELKDKFVITAGKAAEMERGRASGGNPTFDFFVGEQGPVHKRVAADGTVTPALP
ncbi:MAG: hypothetical protein ACXWUP_08110 [Allosphingosinicella sp.]